MIPHFDGDTGYLPPGEHRATWPEFHRRFGWNAHRLWLLEGLRRMAINLRDAGCRAFWVDGSFVTDKEFPSDFDACCDYTGIDVLQLDLTLMGKKEEVKLKYLGELFPEQYLADDFYTFRQFFQTDREDKPKGIIRLDLGSVS